MDRTELAMLGDLNYIEALREQTRACGGTLIEEDGLVLMSGPGSHPVLNYAVRTDPSLDARIAVGVMQDYFEALEHGYTLLVRNAVDDSDLAAVAAGAGLVDLLSPPEMVVVERLADVSPPSDAELREVTDPDGVDDFRSVAAEAWTTYGIPSDVTGLLFETDELLCRPHVAGVVCYEHDRPVACAQMLLSHGISGIFWVSTRAAARGRGYGESCARWVTNRSFDLGARAVSLQASPMGKGIYERMGYTEIGGYRLLARLPPEES